MADRKIPPTLLDGLGAGAPASSHLLPDIAVPVVNSLTVGAEAMNIFYIIGVIVVVVVIAGFLGLHI